MKFTPEAYTRRVFYYETDNMGIVHHANYIRWMEEARMDFMRKLGYVYTDMEKLGIIMPVTSASCKYIYSMHYDDMLKIETKLTSFNGVRASFSYNIYSETDGKLAATGESGHCFLDVQKRIPVNLKKHYLEFYEKAMTIQEKNT